jgi:hypothetical protein
MKTVLFATDHVPPDPKALDYALALCKRLAARLEVLQILRSPADRKRHRRLRSPAMHGVSRTSKPDTGNRPAAEPHADVPLKAEAVDQWQRLHSAHPAAHIDYHVEVAHGTAGDTLEHYVRNHRDIVLTVFDPRSGRYSADSRLPKNRPARKEAMPKLAIPLVLVKKAK